MDNESILCIALLAVFLLLSAYFSATETAFTSMSTVRMKASSEAGDKKAAAALRLYDDFDNVLSTILIGNNIVNIASASVATIIFTKWFGDAGVTVSTAVMTVLVLIFGEISPKSIAKEKPESFACFSTPVLKILVVCFKPLNFIFSKWKKLIMKIAHIGEKSPAITQEELKTILDEASSGGVIDEGEGELLQSALEFSDLTAAEILTPRVDIVAVEADEPLETLGEIFSDCPFSRIPVYKETIDNIVGVVHERDFYRSRSNKYLHITDIMNDAVFVSENMEILNLLRLLQRSKAHMAVAVDEFGGTVGIITLEDILEELVGEIYDEHDEISEEIRKTGEGRYIVDCSANFEDVMEFFGQKPKEEYDFVTVSGWVMYELGKIPEAGDSFVFGSLCVTVTKTDSRRVTEIEIVTGTQANKT